MVLQKQTLFPQDREIVDAGKVRENTTIEQENFDEIEEDIKNLQENKNFIDSIIISHSTNPDAQLCIFCNELQGWRIEAATQNEGYETFLINPGGGDVRISGVDNRAVYVIPTVPTSASSNGKVGQIAVDSNYLYVCVAVNTWKRTALSGW